MSDGIILYQFVAASLLVLLLPGPGVMYVVARSISQGYRAGLISVLGLSLGALVHVATAAIGLSAVLLSSSLAFSVVKMLGAAYLIFLGISAIFSTNSILQLNPLEKQPYFRLFFDGVVISVLNPKIAVFFIAYLPQFIDPSGAVASVQILLLGAIYVTLALFTDGGYAIFSGYIRRYLDGRFMRGPMPKYLSGFLYIGLGVNTALTGRRSV